MWGGWADGRSGAEGEGVRGPGRGGWGGLEWAPGRRASVRSSNSLASIRDIWSLLNDLTPAVCDWLRAEGGEGGRASLPQQGCLMQFSQLRWHDESAVRQSRSCCATARRRCCAMPQLVQKFGDRSGLWQSQCEFGTLPRHHGEPPTSLPPHFSSPPLLPALPVEPSSGHDEPKDAGQRQVGVQAV